MALWCCLGCTTLFAVGLDVCPHCGSGDHFEAGEQVGKALALSKLTKAQLIERAEELRLTLPDSASKHVILEIVQRCIAGV